MQSNLSDDVGDVINNTLLNIKNILDINASIGKPIEINSNTIIVPVSKINVGCLTGGAKLSKKEKKQINEIPFSGGSGTGFNIIPVGFICFLNNDIKFINCNQENNLMDDLSSIMMKSVSSILCKGELKNEK